MTVTVDLGVVILVIALLMLLGIVCIGLIGRLVRKYDDFETWSRDHQEKFEEWARERVHKINGVFMRHGERLARCETVLKLPEYKGDDGVWTEPPERQKQLD